MAHPFVNTKGLLLYFRGRGGREAEGGGLLNRYTVEKPYRGFESLSLRHFIALELFGCDFSNPKLPSDPQYA